MTPDPVVNKGQECHNGLAFSVKSFKAIWFRNVSIKFELLYSPQFAIITTKTTLLFDKTLIVLRIVALYFKFELQLVGEICVMDLQMRSFTRGWFKWRVEMVLYLFLARRCHVVPTERVNGFVYRFYEDIDDLVASFCRPRWSTPEPGAVGIVENLSKRLTERKLFNILDRR